MLPRRGAAWGRQRMRQGGASTSPPACRAPGALSYRSLTQSELGKQDVTCSVPAPHPAAGGAQCVWSWGAQFNTGTQVLARVGLPQGTPQAPSPPERAEGQTDHRARQGGGGGRQPVSLCLSLCPRGCLSPLVSVKARRLWTRLWLQDPSRLASLPHAPHRNSGAVLRGCGSLSTISVFCQSSTIVPPLGVYL